MRDRVSISVKMVNGARWGDLAALSHTHEICAESFKVKDQKYSFAGGHRVRLLKLSKSVHWKLPEGMVVDITNVPDPEPPRRQQHNQR